MANLNAPAQTITWPTSANPPTQNITVPVGSTACVIQWTMFRGPAGSRATSITLDGDAPDFLDQLGIGEQVSGAPCVGTAVWYNPPSGTVAVGITWTGNVSEGPVCTVATAENSGTVRDSDLDHRIQNQPCSATVVSEATDLVLAFAQKFNAPGPSTPAGWTTEATTSNNGENATLASEDAPSGGTSTFSVTPLIGDNNEYPTCAVVSIAEAAVPAPEPAPEPDPPPEIIHLLTAPKPARGIWLPVAGEEVAGEPVGGASYADDFAYANGFLPTVSGGVWADDGGSSRVDAQRVRVNSSNQNVTPRHVAQLNTTTYRVEADVQHGGGNAQAGPMMSMGGSDDTGVYCRANFQFSNYNFEGIVGGSTAWSATNIPITPQTGHRIRIEQEDLGGGAREYRAYIDQGSGFPSTPDRTATDTDVPLTRNAGMYLRAASALNIFLDNWSAEDLGGDPVSTESAPTWLYVPPAPEGPAQVTPDAVNQLTELTIPSLQVHIPVAPDDLTQASTLSIPTIVKDTDILTDNVVHSNVLAEPTVIRQIQLTPDGLVQDNVVSIPEVQLTVFADAVAHSHVLGEPTVRKVAVAADVEQITELSQPTARINVTPVFLGPDINTRNDTTGVPVGPLDPLAPPPLFLVDPVKPQTWSIATGVLPPGLTINQNTGLVSGVPTTAGTYTGISVQVAQDTGSGGATETAVSNTFTWIISDPGPQTGEGQNVSLSLSMGISL